MKQESQTLLLRIVPAAVESLGLVGDEVAGGVEERNLGDKLIFIKFQIFIKWHITKNGYIWEGRICKEKKLPPEVARKGRARY